MASRRAHEQEQHCASDATAPPAAYLSYGSTETTATESGQFVYNNNSDNNNDGNDNNIDTDSIHIGLGRPESRPKHNTLLLLDQGMDFSNCKQHQERQHDTISLLHEERGGDAKPLLQRPLISNTSPKLTMTSKNKGTDNSKGTGFDYNGYSSDNSDGSGDSGTSKGAMGGASGCGKSVGKFRYLVGWLVIFAVTMHTYANYTIYIASIEMISNDVLQSGLTELRAKHLSNDPLAINKNAAAPGTCPAESQLVPGGGVGVNSAIWSTVRPTTTTGATSNGGDGGGFVGERTMNSSELSAYERLALQVDTAALYTSVNERVDSGQLVDWTISQRGYIFTAHNLGGILLAVPINRLALQYGSKVMIFVCIIVTGVRMLLLPTLAGHSPFWVTFVFELIMGGPGASLGILAYPIAAAWLLPEEANFFVAVTQLFNLIGTAATNFITTQLLANQVAWCWCYYLPGALLCLTALLWLVLGADRPGESRFVSRAELELITSSLAGRDHQTKPHERLVGDTNHHEEDRYGPLNQYGTVSGHHANSASSRCAQPSRQHEHLSCFCSAPGQRDKCPANELKRTPNWSTIFTCPTVWALVAVNFSYHWNAKIATLWPTFFANILHLDPSTIGIITGLKGIVALVFGLTFAYLTRSLSERRPFNISLTAYRRVNQVLATLTLGLSVGLMVLLDCNFWANFVSVLLTPVVTGFNAISHEQMPLDLSSEDSGLLVSVIRFVSIGDLLALPASGAILTYAPDAVAGDRLTWRLVWSIGLAVKIITCLLFVVVAKSKPKSYTRLEPAGPCKSETTVPR